MDVPDPTDVAAVEALLGRTPQGPFAVVVRDDLGVPLVIENAPFLDDGTPMPTRYWLVGPQAVRAVARLESDGGVRAAERAVEPAAVAAAHQRYAAARDALIPADHEGPRPSGGVAGTRAGVKCLHAHYAWFLTGGDDPVGRWVDEQLRRRLDVVVDDRTITLTHRGDDVRLPVGPSALLDRELAGGDPPAPEQLTNALGTVADYVDDVVRVVPDLLEADDVRLRGAHVWHLVVVERGIAPPAGPVQLRRADAEAVFRTLATERRTERLHNPGLDPTRVDSVVATCCVVVGLMRKLQLDRVYVFAPAEVSG